MKDYLNEYEGKTILVTGGAGCIGSNLCRKLAGLKANKVVILDDHPLHKNGIFPRRRMLSL
jgi:FlaA1/EpsC-like NDP-sugar epimerase